MEGYAARPRPAAAVGDGDSLLSRSLLLLGKSRPRRPGSVSLPAMEKGHKFKSEQRTRPPGDSLEASPRANDTAVVMMLLTQIRRASDSSNSICAGNTTQKGRGIKNEWSDQVPSPVNCSANNSCLRLRRALFCPTWLNEVHGVSPPLTPTRSLSGPASSPNAASSVEYSLL